jgi:hypothetical protein
LDKPFEELDGQTFQQFFHTTGGYIGKTIRTDIKDEAYKRLSSRYRSRMTGELTAPLLSATGERLSEDQLVKTYGFTAITLAECSNPVNLGMLEHALQTSLQHYPLGKRLWSSPSSAGRKPIGTHFACKLYYAYSRRLPSLISSRQLLVNDRK